MEQLSKMMKVEDFDIDLDFEMKLKFILSRAEQLVRQEGTALVETKSLTYSLQRKVDFVCFLFLLFPSLYKWRVVLNKQIIYL